LDWTAPPRRTKVDIKPSTLATINRGLRKVVQEGTGYAMNQAAELPPAGFNTSTAESSTWTCNTGCDTSKWAYTNGEIVVVAFAQNTPGGGSVHALPMARQVLQVWAQQRSR